MLLSPAHTNAAENEQTEETASQSRIHAVVQDASPITEQCPIYSEMEALTRLAEQKAEISVLEAELAALRVRLAEAQKNNTLQHASIEFQRRQIHCLKQAALQYDEMLCLAILRIDRAGRIKSVNSSFCKLIDSTSEALIGSKLISLLEIDSANRLQCLIEGMLTSESPALCTPELALSLLSEKTVQLVHLLPVMLVPDVPEEFVLLLKGNGIS